MGAALHVYDSKSYFKVTNQAVVENKKEIAKILFLK